MTKMPSFDLTLLRLNMLKHQFTHDPIDGLILGIAAHAKQEHTKLIQRENDLKSDYTQEELDRHFLHDAISDDYDFVTEIVGLSHELAIIALYRTIELTTVRALKVAYPDAEKETYRIDKQKEFLKKMDVDIESLTGYTAMDETRLINNAIKHAGKVSKELATYRTWKKDAPLADLDTAYSRLAPLCGEYVEAFVDELIKKRHEALGI
jgi:hypothetical protein